VPTIQPNVDIRRAGERFSTQLDWLDSHHSFSFNYHYDPENTHFGLLLVSNDDVIAADTGFKTHPHRDMEIVTWVLDGELEHKDSEGHKGLIYPGLAQRMSAGTGIFHSEMNPTRETPVHLVQMWVVPDTERIRPAYAQLDINSELSRGGLVPVASGRGHDAAISIRQDGATLWAARMKAGETVTLPDAPWLHLFVAKGEVTSAELGSLGKGDAARLTLPGALRVTAGPAGAEILAWEITGRCGSRERGPGPAGWRAARDAPGGMLGGRSAHLHSCRGGELGGRSAHVRSRFFDQARRRTAAEAMPRRSAEKPAIARSERRRCVPGRSVSVARRASAT
jgi:redox-sensitive bicupin YhaK (pirin superfamily)